MRIEKMVIEIQDKLYYLVHDDVGCQRCVFMDGSDCEIEHKGMCNALVRMSGYGKVHFKEVKR